MSEETTANSAAGGGQQFNIQKVYLKDASLETPSGAKVFTMEWKPEINVEMNSKTTQLDNGVYDIALSVTVTAKLGDSTAFLVEVHQAGIFTIQGFNEQEMGHMLGSYCPNTLFPFAREAVSDLIVRAGFPQLLLTPVNFDALYHQHLQQQAAQGEGQPEVAH